MSQIDGLSGSVEAKTRWRPVVQKKHIVSYNRRTVSVDRNYSVQCESCQAVHRDHRVVFVELGE